MNPKPNKTKRKYLKGIAATIAALLIGALGNGVWEGILRPIFGSGRDALLNIVSLGMKSIKDMTYAQIAEGLHEEASMNVLVIIVTLLCLGMAFAIFLTISDSLEAVRTDRQSAKEIKPSLSEESPSGKDNPKNQEKAVPEALLPRRAIIPNVVFVFLFLVALPGLVADYLRFKYTNSAITHFQQVYTIAGPHMEELDRKRVLASFAQVRNREDYVLVVANLEEIAKQNGQTVPAFDPW